MPSTGLAVADKPLESYLTIPAELHRAVMDLSPEDRQDRAKVNEAAAREGWPVNQSCATRSGGAEASQAYFPLSDELMRVTT